MKGSPEQIQNYIKKSQGAYEVEQRRKDTGNVLYTISRRFFQRSPVEDPLGQRYTSHRAQALSINERLPRFRGVEAGDLLARIVQSAQSQVRVLDLGCGRGEALRDLEILYGDRIRAQGMSASLFADMAISPRQVVLGNINELGEYAKLIPFNQYDFIYSAYTLMHTGQHVFDHALRVFPHLAPDGVALLDARDGFMQMNRAYGLDQFKTWLSHYGYDIEMQEGRVEGGVVTGISLRRTNHSQLLLPMTHEFDWDDNFIGFAFDEQKAQEYGQAIEAGVI